MNKKRLQDMISVLRKVKPANFDMTMWWLRKPGCGTVGCAIGHYIHAYPERELKIDNMGLPSIPSRGIRGIEAIATHFDIIHIDVVELFIPQRQESKSSVIKRIQSFIDGEKP